MMRDRCEMLLVAAVVSALTTGGSAQVRTRWHEYTENFKTPRHPVEVRMASFVGGAGTEWLAGASFLSDGSLVLAGTACGPQLSVAGKAAEVIGTDGPAPADPGSRSNALASLNWTWNEGAPFVVWTDPGMKQVQRVLRLPWGSGSCCGMATDGEDGIYVAGMAGPNLNAAFACQDVTGEGAEKSKSSVFVLKIAPDGRKVQWGRAFANAGKGVRVRRCGDRILVEGEWGYVFMPDGKVDRIVRVGKTKGTGGIINPTDWSFAFGWDNNTNTGREPWRRPGLRIEFPPEANRESCTLFRWEPKLVGSDKYRLVSDSSIRLIHFDDRGRLWAVGWSDGGNTVFDRQPLDLDKNAPKDAIGFSTWGANAGSFAHVMCISTGKFETVAKAIWSGYLTGKNKPAGGSVEELGVGTDGSLLLTGAMAYGLIQTGDNLSPEQGNAGGPYIAVLEPDLSSIRFSSAFLGCGKVKLHDGNGWLPKWNIAAKVVKGRHLAVFVSGAVKEEQRQMGMVPAPSRNAIQTKFGGGTTDGYVAVIDLGQAGR